MASGGTTLLKVDVNGNLGIGKTPGVKLDVNGVVNATGFTINGGSITVAQATPTTLGTLYGQTSSIGTNALSVGYNVLALNTGQYNTGVGTNSLNANTSGNWNTGLGFQALASVTTGSNNTAIGVSAIQYGQTVQNNVGIGPQSLYNSTTASDNTSVGAFSGQQVTSGTQNVIIGSGAANSGTNNLTTGSNNIIIGYNASSSSATVSNEITLGNSSITALRIPGIGINASGGGTAQTNIGIQSGSQSKFWISAISGVNLLSFGGNGGSAPTSGALNIDGSGNVAIANTTPAGKLSVKLASSTVNPAAWDTTYAIFGNPDSATGAGLGIGYNSTNNASMLVSLAPNTAWKSLQYYASDHNFFITNGVSAVTINSSGLATFNYGLSGKINKRVTSITTSSTPSPNSTTDDIFLVTALASAATFAAPSGTPTQGQQLLIRIKDNGTAQTLAFNSIYRASADLAFPTATVANKTLYLGFVYNATDTKWDMIARLGNF